MHGVVVAQGIMRSAVDVVARNIFAPFLVPTKRVENSGEQKIG